jgi:hypothetical protein
MSFRDAAMYPWWLAQLLSGAKSFADNPLLGSRRLNALGLHTARLRAAHALANRRRNSLADMVSTDDRTAFDRDGVVQIRDFLPDSIFHDLRQQILSYKGAARETVQGDTITRRLAVDTQALTTIPALRHFTMDPRWRGLARYVSSFDIEPLLYIQTIMPHRHDAAPDPQHQLHADTFHPSMKAWLFLEDVPLETGPFSYVHGSHRLTPERLAWEKSRSLTAKSGDCRLSARGSLRVRLDELASLNLPAPTVYDVPANTLVIADTFGFHARSEATEAATRIELWAYGRRNPFRIPTGWDVWSLPGLQERRIPFRWWLIDQMHPLIRRHWHPVGLKSPADE